MWKIFVETNVKTYFCLIFLSFSSPTGILVIFTLLRAIYLHFIGTLVLSRWQQSIIQLYYRYHFTHLSRGQNGNIIFVNHSCLFFYFFWVVFLLEILTRQPEQNVFLAVFASQKLSEHSPPACNVFYLDKEYYHASTTTFEYILQFLNFEINTSIIKCSRIAEMGFSLVESGVCQKYSQFRKLRQIVCSIRISSAEKRKYPFLFPLWLRNPRYSLELDISRSKDSAQDWTSAAVRLLQYLYTWIMIKYLHT